MPRLRPSTSWGAERGQASPGSVRSLPWAWSSSRRPRRGDLQERGRHLQRRGRLRGLLLVGVILLVLGLGAAAWWEGRGFVKIPDEGAYRARFSWVHVGSWVSVLPSRWTWAEARELHIMGRVRTDPQALREALGIHEGDSLARFDPVAARARIEQLPWVFAALVERLWPETIRVRLIEREPLALWQTEGKNVVVDLTGTPLVGVDPADFTNLPLISGTGAPQKAPAFLAALGRFPTLALRTRAAVYIGQRRWDLELVGPLLARLPETNVEESLERLTGLIRDNRILERSLAVVDLRVPGRLILEKKMDINAPSAAPFPSGAHP